MKVLEQGLERRWKVVQDRMVAEMRFENVRSMTEANKFLIENFPANYWNKEHNVKPREPSPHNKKLDKVINLKEIFCLKFKRIIGKDHTFSWKGKLFLIKNPPCSLTGQTVEIRFYQVKNSKT